MRAALLTTSLLVALLVLAHRLDPVAEGLAGTYYDGGGWLPASAVASVRERPSTKALFDFWKGAPPQVFSASWAGSLLAVRDGVYTLATSSDDGSWVYVDGKLVVDNGGRHVPVLARGTIKLDRGVHALFIRYAQEGGEVQFELMWATPGNSGRADGTNPAGERLEPVPDWVLTPKTVTSGRFLGTAVLRRTLAAVEWLWAGVVFVTVLLAAWRLLLRVRFLLQQADAWPALAWILGGAAVLIATGLWWGLPGGSWAPDELTPLTVMSAARKGFSNGWYDRYPPFHYYVLTAAYSPLILFQSLGRIDLEDPPVYALLAVIGRAISVAAAIGTLIAVYACGRRAFGRRAGLFAAAMLALVTPFVYYAKTANLDVPYVFWFSVSLVFYLRALESPALPDILAFAVSATLAVCTKDQAYGLYLLAPFVLVHRLWQLNRDSGLAHPLKSAVFDRRLLTGLVAAAVLFVFCHNLLLNRSGFVEHVRFITGGGSQGYRGFEPTLAGRASLLSLTVKLLTVAWGWPLFLAGAGGFIMAVMERRTRRMAVWLAAPAAAYYLGFIDVVLYNYDRFVLPICAVMAIFGGLAFDRWLAPAVRPATWRTIVIAAAFAYTLVYAVTVDYLMLRDSRYTIERWLAANVERTDLVGFVFPLQYYPRLDAFKFAEISSLQELQQDRPAYYVLNADYARAEPRDSSIGKLIAGLQERTSGYDLVFQFRQATPWPWLPGIHPELAGDRTEMLITSALRHINPTYQVFKRGTAP